MDQPRIIQTVTRFFSTVFSPLLVPTYGIALSLWMTYLQYTPLKTRVTVLLMTFALTCMVPVIGIFTLHHMGIVKDPRLRDRKDRLVPYIISAAAYVGVAFYMARIHAPQWLTFFMLGSGAAALTTMAVNLKWKISGHATAMGGLTAMTFFFSSNGYLVHESDILLILALAASGCVMTSRLLMQRHSLAQVAAGFTDGAAWIILFQLLAG